MKKAMMKIKASLTNNVGIKIIAVIIATLIWLTVVNISDPEKTIVIYNIPITITHENAITDMNMVYNVDRDASVNITVSGKRSIVSRLSADDFKATASLKELSKVNSVPVEIVAKQNSIGRKVTIEKQSIQTLEIGVEEIKKQTFSIQAEYIGNVAEGYVTGDYTLSRNNVTVEAPESILDRIDRVVAQCDVDGETDDFTKKSAIVLYDKHGRQVKSNDITISAKTIKVSVIVLKEKEVPIVVNNISSPLSGYHVEAVETKPENVILIGKKEQIDGIESIIVADTIDITDKAKDTLEKIDIKKYLPEGVSVRGDSLIEVRIQINKLVTRKFTIDTDDIVIEDLNRDYEVTFSNKSVSAQLQGEDKIMKNISSKDIRASIDIKNYKEGTETVDVSVVIPDGTVLLNNVTAKVKIKKKKK